MNFLFNIDYTSRPTSTNPSVSIMYFSYVDKNTDELITIQDKRDITYFNYGKYLQSILNRIPDLILQSTGQLKSTLTQVRKSYLDYIDKIYI